MALAFLRAVPSAILALAGLLQAAPVCAQPVSQPVPVAELVSAAARRFALPERWIYAVIRAESAGNPQAISPKGAAGLMQIMPATWAYLRARYQLGGNIYDPRDNILAGAAYLRELYDRYGAPGFLAAYNAGPQQYEASLRGGRSLPAETVAYVAKLAPITGGGASDAVAARADPRAWMRSSVFAQGSVAAAPQPAAGRPQAFGLPPADRRPAQRPVPDGLFPLLSGQHPQ